MVLARGDRLATLIERCLALGDELREACAPVFERLLRLADQQIGPAANARALAFEAEANVRPRRPGEVAPVARRFGIAGYGG